MANADQTGAAQSQAGALVSAAAREHAQGKSVEAVCLLEGAIQIDRSCFDAWIGLGMVQESLARPAEAIKAYEMAMKLSPGHGFPFGRHTILRLRQRWGPPPQPRARASESRRGRVTASELGIQGRFANQLLQYAFVRLYSEQYQLDLEVPDWLGRDLFDLDDPLPGPALRPVSETEIDLAAILRDGKTPLVDVDIRGHFCGSSAWAARQQELFRSLFRPGAKAAAEVNPALARLPAAGTRIAIHLRWGDLAFGPYRITPVEWYLNWLDSVIRTLDRWTLYIATDDPRSAAPFARFNPIMASDLGPLVRGAEFLTDFYVLSQADIMAISNSTFSFVASMLNRRCTQFLRPQPQKQCLISYDPWNSEAML